MKSTVNMLSNVVLLMSMCLVFLCDTLFTYWSSLFYVVKGLGCGGYPELSSCWTSDISGEHCHPDWPSWIRLQITNIWYHYIVFGRIFRILGHIFFTVGQVTFSRILKWSSSTKLKYCPAFLKWLLKKNFLILFL